MGEKQKREAMLRRVANKAKGEAFLARLSATETAESVREAARLSITKQDCPMCGESGFKMVALHIFQAHGINERQLREMFGFMFIDSICSKALSESRIKNNEGRNPRIKGAHAYAEPSKAGLAALKQSRKHSFVAKSSKEQKQAAGRLGALSGWARKKRPNSETG